MGELTSRVLQQVKDAQTFDDIKDWIWMAGDLIRRATSPGFHSGFEEIDHEEVSMDERSELKDALLQALARSSDPLYVGSILSALGCTFDKDLLPLWIDYLARYLGLLKSSNMVVFSALLALRDLGEPVFKNAMSACAADVEINTKEAQEYLARLGIVVPW